MDCTYEHIDEIIRCTACLHQRPWGRAQFPRRNCPGVLDWRGRILFKLKPGAGLALLIKYSGAKAAAEWAEFIEKDCPTCKNREAQIDAGWKRFIWRKFATPV